MSVAPPTLIAPEEDNSFASNNPFRRRASQVPPISPTSPFGPPSPGLGGPGSQRPQSRNPFLDVFDDLDDINDKNNGRPRTAHKYSFDSSTEQRPQFTGASLDLFNNLSVTDKPNPTAQKNPNKDMDRMKPPPRQQGNGGPRQPISSSQGPRNHHSRPSDPLLNFDNSPMIATDRRRNGPPPPVGARKPVPAGRPRRNSDSSVLEVHEIDKERERRERRKREEARRAENGNGGKTSSSKDRRKKGTPLDVIDKLDVTGIYGSGLFHHDGPFDACNPHRNKNSRRAPMQAFPADSANNALTGFGPVQKSDHSEYFGNRDPEAFSEWSGRRPSDVVRPSANRAQSFDPVARVEPIHGDETLGLGTSTFLDGAPASRKAIESQAVERVSEEGDRPTKLAGVGVARKKSLAQKIRSISTSRGGHQSFDRERRTPNSALTTPTLMEGQPSPGIRKKDTNPFFNDYDQAYDKKGEQITVVEKGRDRAPSSPKKPYGLLGKDKEGESSTGGSLMKRVRSLSKPKRRDQVQ